MPSAVEARYSLRDTSPKEEEIIRQLNRLGAASADQLAVKLNRIGENLTPELEALAKRRLLKAKTVKLDGFKARVYITCPEVRHLH